MSSDQEFAAHLRERLDVIAPDVGVDTSVVVPGGRRRRRVTALAGVAATSLVLRGRQLGGRGCDAGPGTPSSHAHAEWTAPAWFAEQAAQRAAFRDSARAVVARWAHGGRVRAERPRVPGPRSTSDRDGLACPVRSGLHREGRDGPVHRRRAGLLDRSRTSHLRRRLGDRHPEPLPDARGHLGVLRPPRLRRATPSVGGRAGASVRDRRLEPTARAGRCGLRTATSELSASSSKPPAPSHGESALDPVPGH